MGRDVRGRNEKHEMMETREEVMVVARGATRMSEAPELGITFSVKDKSGRQKIEQQNVCLSSESC